jgi:putative hydrolase of the HAD superfamily
MEKIIFFDLDNTLYDSEDYYSGAFKEISLYLSKKYSLEDKKIYSYFLSFWKTKTSMYPFLFNRMLKKFNLEKEINNVINLFQEYSGNLKLDKEVSEVFEYLKKKGHKIGLITDGNVERQKRKLKLLGINNFFDVTIFTKEFNSPKPSIIPFKIAIEKSGLSPESCVYIGDNPLTDFEGAKKAGMKTIRLLKGEFKNLSTTSDIDYEIASLKNTINLFEKWN